MEMELDTQSDPTPLPMPSSGNLPNAAGAAPHPPQSPSTALCPREYELPSSPPRATPSRRRTKPLRAATVDLTAGSPRRKRLAAGEARSSSAAAAAASPGRSVRRARRRLEKDGVREMGKEAAEEEAARMVRRRKTGKGRAVVVKEHKGLSMAVVPFAPNIVAGEAKNVQQSDWEELLDRTVELVMWRNVGRSAFWFGSGSMFFYCTSCSREINFSLISAVCNFGVVALGLAFFKASIPQRQHSKQVWSLKLTEEDILQAARAALPIANSVISMAQVIFSGDPSMTLKVLPVLMFGAKYGHLLTVWRLLATGFFSCFTLPKLYDCYSSQVHGKVNGLKDRILNAWKSCPRKKLVAAAVVTTCWNLFNVKTRIMAVFTSLVTLRYYYQYLRPRTSKKSDGRNYQK